MKISQLTLYSMVKTECFFPKVGNKVKMCTLNNLIKNGGGILTREKVKESN